MPGILDFVSTVTGRVVVVAFAGFIFSLIYFWVDIYLFLTKRHFGRVNIESVHFTRNDYEKKSDALHFDIIKESVSLRQACGNKLLFWWVILRSAKATYEDPVVSFGKFYFAALVSFRGHVAEKCAPAVFRRMLGYQSKQERCKLVMVYDGLKDKRSVKYPVC